MDNTAKLVIGSLVNAALAAAAGPVAAQDAPRQELRPYSAGVLIAADNRKSLREENSLPSTTAPVLNPISPDNGRAQSLALPERRGPIQQMLQAHEFTFGQRNDALTSKDAAKATGVDLDAVRLRVSKDSVLLRAQFRFN